jgi:hypothetical protein
MPGDVWTYGAIAQCSCVHDVTPQLEFKTLFTKRVKLRVSELPRWEPRIVIDDDDDLECCDFDQLTIGEAR